MQITPITIKVYIKYIYSEEINKNGAQLIYTSQMILHLQRIYLEEIKYGLWKKTLIQLQLYIH